MIQNKKVIVVLPAFNAETTLERTYSEIPRDFVDEIILTDDGSTDKTAMISRKLGIRTFIHEKNRGYGANQKTCYQEAFNSGADIIVLLHPDYQYNPRLIPSMCSMIAENIYDVVLGSRILGKNAIMHGMPAYKYISNRALTLIENTITGHKLSEYHTGYRAFSRKVFETIPILENSDDFVFDNEILLQSLFFGFRIGEISCPASYHRDASTVDFRRSVKYGVGVLFTGLKYVLARKRLLNMPIFSPQGRKLLGS